MISPPLSGRGGGTGSGGSGAAGSGGDGGYFRSGREAFGQGVEDGFGDALRVFGHFVVPEGDHAPASAFESAGAILVGDGIDMLAAVELNDQPRLAAGEIGDVGADDELAGEAGAIGRKYALERAFGGGGVGVERPGVGGKARRDAGHFVTVAKFRYGINSSPCTQEGVGGGCLAGS